MQIIQWVTATRTPFAEEALYIRQVIKSYSCANHTEQETYGAETALRWNQMVLEAHPHRDRTFTAQNHSHSKAQQRLTHNGTATDYVK